MKIDEIKKELSNGDVMSAMPKLRDLVAKEPDNQEAKVLYGTCCHICGDDETFVRIDDELAKDRNFYHKRKYRKYHAMRVAACGAVAVAMTAAVLPAPVDAATRQVRGASTLYGAFYDDCETDTIRIYFNNGGGSGSMSTVTRKVDYCSYSIYTLPACRFTRSGYTFAGWEVSNPCMYTSSLFQPGEDFELSPGCGDFHLTAHWSKTAAERYSLTVDPNGGYLSGSNFGDDNGGSWSTSVTVTRGGTAYYSLGRATRSGYTFTGWWTSSYGGTRVFDSNGNCIVGNYWNSAKQWIYQGNVTLYAQWRENVQRYTLTVNPNGGYLSGGNFGGDNGGSWSTSVTVTKGGSAYYSLGRATRSGYTFTGWWTSSYGGTRVFDSNGNCIVGSYWNSAKQWIYPGSVTLYAQWRENAQQYTLTVDPNGGYLSGGNFGGDNGGGWSTSVTVTKGRSAYYSLGRATRSGYTFTGWWTSPSGGTRVFDSNGNCIVGSYWNSAKQWIYPGSVTLYAQWQASVPAYTLTVQPNGGCLRGGNFGGANETTGSASVKVSYGRSAYSSLGRATRHNYTFTGWWTSPSGGTRVFDSNGNCVVGSYWNSAKQWTYRGNITLYAQWQACSYQRTSTSGGGLWTKLSDGSWRSGSIADGQSTSIARNVSGARTVTFRWKTSSEGSYDKLTFYVDGVEQKSISGEMSSWESASVQVYGNGMHTLRWTYSKDGSVSYGSDCGWINDVRW